MSSTAPVGPIRPVSVRFVWDMPLEPPTGPLFDCDNRAYAANNPDKCGIQGPFLLGGGAPRGGGFLSGIGRALHDLTGGLL